MAPAQNVSPEDVGTREKIIDAARHEFAELGLAGARVERIAANAGVNKAMIYYHFSSKELLYQNVVRSFFTRVVTELRSRTSAGTNLEEFLMGALETHIFIYRNHPEFLRIMLRELANPDGDAVVWMAEIIRESQFPLETVGKFKLASETGAFRKIDPQQALISFVMMSLGYLMLAPMADRVWGIEDRVAFIEQRKHAIVDLFLHGVLAR
ncbi:MAG: TetR family transcriptional regulator [bacterium]|nr:TetR family transcriptional regulator [bacterium]